VHKMSSIEFNPRLIGPGRGGQRAEDRRQKTEDGRQRACLEVSRARRGWWTEAPGRVPRTTFCGLRPQAFPPCMSPHGLQAILTTAPIIPLSVADHALTNPCICPSTNPAPLHAAPARRSLRSASVNSSPWSIAIPTLPADGPTKTLLSTQHMALAMFSQ